MTQQVPGTAPEQEGKVAAAGEPPTDAANVHAQGMEIKARSQGELVRRRFFRHRGALGGMIVLAFVVLAAFTLHRGRPDPRLVGQVVPGAERGR